MGFWNRFRGAATQVAQKASSVGRMLVVNPGQPAWTPRDYSSFAKEAYSKNVVAYQAINRVADAVANVKWIARRGKQELTTHPILDLLKQPNPSQSGVEYWRAKVGFFLIAGNAYEERIVVGRRVQEIWPLRPDRMQVIPGESGMPSGYVYKVGGRKHQWDADPMTGISDVRHYKSFHPTDDWYGLSPVEAGAFSVDQHNEAMAWMQALLQNSAKPSGALMVGKDGELTDDQFNRLKVEIEESHSGARNAGRPMLLEGGLEWKQMGLSPSDMGILESKYSSARDVCLAFGVPPQLLGIPGDNTYSNYREARLAFYEDTVLPLIGYFMAEFNHWMRDLYGDVEIHPDLESIEAIVEKRRELWAMADKSMDLTLNEVREIKGYEPLPAPLGDTLMAELRKGMQQADSPEEKAYRIAFGR